ncbi:MAG: histidine phosphatase family protein [Chloroflexota bacterium]
MKTLSILRHAKTERWLNMDGEVVRSDFERALTPRGHEDAALIANTLRKLEPAVDLIVSSTAVRARQTTEHIVTGLNPSESTADMLAPQWEDAVYGANETTLLQTLDQLPDQANHVLMVGHNPGVTYLVAGLLAGSSRHLTLDMPTAALAHLSLGIYQWSQIQWGCAQLHVLIKPKLLR